MIVEGQVLKDERTLRRLETLVDSVFALVIVLFVLDFPRPDGLSGIQFGDFMSAQLQTILRQPAPVSGDEHDDS